MPITKGQFRSGLDSYLASLNLHAKVKSSLDSYLESYEDELIDIVNGMIDQYHLGGTLTGIVNPRSGEFLARKHPFFIPILIGIAGAIIGAVVSTSMQPVTQGMQKDLNRVVQGTLPPTNVLLTISRNIPSSKDRMLDLLSQQGFNADMVSLMLMAGENKLDKDESRQAWLRGIIPERQMLDYMNREGIPDYEGKILRDLAFYIPPVQDLITMAVREAFTDTAARKFGLDDNFPDSVLVHTRSQGLSDEWMHRYWRAHWQLPSIGQAFEMFQRLRPGSSKTAFDRSDLEEFLVTADVPSYFRERLTQIAYNTITRVDIRRLYRMGIYDENKVLQSYLNAGYSPEDSKDLTKFTVLDAIDEDSGITRATILQAFRNGTISLSEAKQRLVATGHSNIVANFYLDIELKNRDEEAKQARIEFIVTRFVEGIITEAQFTNELNQVAVVPEEREVIRLKALSKRESRIALPSKSDVDNWYSSHIISDGEYVSYLTRRGYSLVDARRYLLSIQNELAEKARDDSEKKAKENSRLQQDALASNYQKQTAQIDLDIAQLNLQIANAKLAITSSEDENIVNELTQRIAQLTVQIKQKQVDKARLRT